MNPDLSHYGDTLADRQAASNALAASKPQWKVYIGDSVLFTGSLLQCTAKANLLQRHHARNITIVQQ